LFKIPTNGGTPLRRATNDAGELFEDRNVYYDANFGDELSCQQNFHIAISDGSWNGSNSSVGISGNKDNSTTTLPDTNVYTPGSLMYSDNNSTSLADVAFYYWSRDLRSSLDNNVPTYIEDYTDKDGNIVTIGVNETWLDKPSLYWNPKNDPASWQHMVNFNVGLGIEGSFNRETDLPRLRSGALNWPDINGDTCYKYQPVFVNGSPVSVNEVETSCQRHVCYDTFDDSGNEIDCALYQDPWGPVKYCENLSDGGRSINCDNRIVRYVLESQGRVDDVWHSSINSRGDYFSARNPAELADALYNVVSNIITRKGRSSAGSVSSNIITDGTLSFKTGYDTSNWSGFVIAQQIEQDGSPGEVKWDAACKLTGGFCTATGESETATNDFESRNIYAFDKSSSGTGGTQREFDDSLPTAMKDKILNSNYYNEVLTNNPSDIFTADDVIDYIRGDKSTENSQGGIFRNRQNLLGDVIHSTAKVVRGPSSGYKDSDWEAGTPEYVAANADPKNGYKEYRTRLKNRTSILLVGANDGMLHAFDSGINGGNNGGHEYWAFIPSKSLDGISELANPLYSHKTYVDLSPTVKDAFIDGNWGTYAVGGLRKGGKEFYGLKLNDDPSQAPEILWEFTDKDDGDLGYTYNEARITRVINKTTGDVKWVALVPNGYNSSNHQSVLFALDLKTGSKLFTWKTGVGNLSTPNGMGPPVDADFVNRSGLYMSDQATDYAYAGDLAGNVYRFDMQDIFSGVSSSAPKKIYSGTYDRAITTSPRVFTPGNGIDQNVIVVFGTGKYIELTDRATTGVADQYIIGIKDSNGNTISPFTSLNDSRLVSQNLTAVGDNVSRILTSYPVGSTQGWKIKLIKAGERMVNEIGRNNQLKLAAIATIIPNGQDPCKAGGESWIMVIDARSGGKPIIGNFFNNGASTGIYVDDLILGFTALTTVGGNQQQYQIDVVGSGDSSGTVTIDVTSNKWRRRSWHRILID
jgi:type IV pilus assembly protein PilY1